MNDELILATYESISRLTRQMLAAARNGDWDGLVRHERECSGLFARLMNGEDQRPRGTDFQRRKAELIRGVLDDDAEIRLLVEPWMANLAILLGHAGRQRRLSQTYQSGE
ncbi:MAG: flagellar protein FliT [Betaproteobacteria bacterium]|nr:flagellar protein FliT [Betaproteobacteria bacterium]